MIEIPGLPPIPWWMLLIGGVSFVITIAGVIIWQIIQNKVEAADEAQLASGKGLAPPMHPEPLKSWCTMACAAVDLGTSWADEPPQKAQTFLRNMWSATGAQQIEERLTHLSQQEPSAWNLVGALRVALAASSAHYLDVPRSTQWARQIAGALQQRYPSFDAIGQEYLAARRQWKNLPPDGSGDDAEQTRLMQGYAQVVAQNFRGVDYRAAL